MTKLTRAAVEEAHGRYYKGERLEAVAADYGVVPTAFFYRFKLLGLPLRPRLSRRIKMSYNELLEVVTHAKAGASQETLAYNLDMSIPTLRRILREAGVETDPRRRKQQEER
jgi:hypothetical protein